MNCLPPSSKVTQVSWVMCVSLRVCASARACLCVYCVCVFLCARLYRCGFLHDFVVSWKWHPLFAAFFHSFSHSHTLTLSSALDKQCMSYVMRSDYNLSSIVKFFACSTASCYWITISNNRWSINWIAFFSSFFRFSHSPRLSFLFIFVCNVFARALKLKEELCVDTHTHTNTKMKWD